MNIVDIFIGEKKVTFVKNFNPQSKKSNKNIILTADNDPDCLVISFNRLIRSARISELIIPGNISSNFKNFSGRFKIIKAAGGLISNREGNFLFIYRYNKWDLPKGKIDKGETVRHAAVRECEEECAVNKLKIVEKIPATYHMYQLKGEWVLKKTFWFKMKTKFNGKLVPQIEEGITKVEWLAEKDFRKVRKNTYPAIKKVLDSIEN